MEKARKKSYQSFTGLRIFYESEKIKNKNKIFTSSLF